LGFGITIQRGFVKLVKLTIFPELVFPERENDWEFYTVRKNGQSNWSDALKPAARG
jgi:hypothetical protein